MARLFIVEKRNWKYKICLKKSCGKSINFSASRIPHHEIECSTREKKYTYCLNTNLKNSYSLLYDEIKSSSINSYGSKTTNGQKLQIPFSER